MVHGANKTKGRRKRFVRTPSGTKARYEERKPGKARCPSGRPLPGVAHGNRHQITRSSKTQRRPSRPFGGVLSSPVMRAVMRDYARDLEPAESETGDVFGIGRVCVKVAGRDAGRICVIVKQEDDRVLIDGDVRRRKVNTTHLEPTGHQVKVKEGASHEDVVKALEEIEVEVEERIPQKERAGASKKSASKKSTAKKPAKQAKSNK